MLEEETQTSSPPETCAVEEERLEQHPDDEDEEDEDESQLMMEVDLRESFLDMLRFNMKFIMMIFSTVSRLDRRVDYQLT